MKENSKNTNLTPMMEQFFRLKKQNPEFILFFRMGDFYEMFDEDAQIASRILGLTLTKRQQFDMCGIPHHAKDNYLYKMVQAGYKIAICEQVETTDASNKKMFDRKVMQLITPGTFQSEQLTQKEKNQFLMSLYAYKNKFYFAFADIATGRFVIGSCISTDQIMATIYKFDPSEIIIASSQETNLNTVVRDRYYSLVDIKEYTQNQTEFLKSQFQVMSLSALELDEIPLQSVVFVNLQYIKHNLFKDIKHINTLERLQAGNNMYLNETTVKNLELLEAQGDNDKHKYSLFSHLNITKTPMGARYLRHLVVHPSIQYTTINERLNNVETFKDDTIALKLCRQALGNISDLERLLSKISFKTANPKDILALKNGFKITEQLKKDLPKKSYAPIENSDFNLLPIISLIESILVEEPPVEIGDIATIKDSYSEELAILRNKAQKSYQVLLDIEKREQEKNNLPRLRIKYNKVLGYYIEIPKGGATKVPSYFIRKQSLVNLERFTIEELMNFEQEVLTAKDNLYQLEKQIFNDLCEKLMEFLILTQKNIELIKNIDVYTSFAQLAIDYNYNRPTFTQRNELRIIEGRHPVVEKYASIFTSNSVSLNDSDNRLWLLSGPNMAGKSTFLRQTAIIVLMAHIGCFIPATSAVIPITDQIFTRIGASDNLAKGESTFLVEMAEASSILNFATSKSLIIMDEIGRGTSTNDGLALAWAMVEYLCDPEIIRGKTLFATHYHELSELENTLTGVKNYRMAVKENQDGIVFLHKIEAGSAQRSYGIHVAAIAGIPKSIINRANKLLAVFNSTNKLSDSKPTANMVKIEQSTLKTVISTSNKDYLENIEKQINKVDINRITGIEALTIISNLKKELSKKEKRNPDTENGILF